MSADVRPFRLQGAFRKLPFAGVGEFALERLTGLHRLDSLYHALPPIPAAEFPNRVLELFGVTVDVAPAELEAIPREGAAVLVANHPFGAIEGVILAALLRQRRPDVKIMANYLLSRIPELSDLFIPVDPFGGQGATRRNAAPLREAVRHLRNGGLLVLFPAGAVSHLHLARRDITDPPWNATVGRLVQMTGAPVVPLFFEGRNSALFQSLGLIHPRLRTLLLAREFLNKAQRRIRLRVGRLIPHSRLKDMDENAMTTYLRLRTYALGALPQPKPAEARALHPAQEPVASAVSSALLAAEVEALPEQQCLERSGDLQVCYARASQIPWLMQELGRLRELSFRQTGEGTGRASDIDLYDAYYLHLFVWNSVRRELVGAYRLGLADEILRQYGKKGLYTHSLFRYRTRLLQELNPAIELGRSFVRPEYQRSYAPLLLLWKGIGQFVARHPQYRVLFGPVSISNDYQTVSRQLLVEFLRANNYLPELARHVKPRRPFRADRRRLAGEFRELKEVEDVSELLSVLEGDNKGVPVLIRQYLKLGGRLLGFNVDPQFSDALDGLIVVDLALTEPKVLARYMGKEQANAFLAQHQQGEQRSA